MSVSSFTFFKLKNKLNNNPMLSFSDEEKQNIHNVLEEFKTNLNQLENAIHTEFHSSSTLKH